MNMYEAALRRARRAQSSEAEARFFWGTIVLVVVAIAATVEGGILAYTAAPFGF